MILGAQTATSRLTDPSALSIAVVHEWVSARAGSEKVFEQLARILPSADLYCMSREPDVHLPALADREITTTWLDRSWLRGRRALALPAMPLAWRSLRSDPYDLIVTSSHAFSRFFATEQDRLHLCYTHAPMRYAWDPDLDARGVRGGALGTAARFLLRAVDRQSACWTTGWAANSRNVAQRLRRAYGVSNPRIIPPPVEISRFLPSVHKSDYVVALSRFVPYKRLDLAIQAADRAGAPIKVLGAGPEHRALAALAAEATVPVELVVNPSDGEVEKYLAEARALIFPAKEDFGIVPVEAQAAGTPVLAVTGHGADDTVVHGKTGWMVADQSAASLAQGLIELLAADLDSSACVTNAGRFSTMRFEASIKRWISDELNGSPVSTSCSIDLDAAIRSERGGPLGESPFLDEASYVRRLQSLIYSDRTTT